MVNDYKAKDSQDIFQISNIVLNGMDNIVNGILAVSGISLITVLASGQNVYYDDSYYQSNTLQIQLNVPEPDPNYTVTGLFDQSTFDICLMQYGNLDAMLTLINDNPVIMNLNDVNCYGKTISLNTNKIIVGNNVAVIQKNRYIFATLYDVDYEIERITEDGFLRLTEDNNYRIT